MWSSPDFVDRFVKSALRRQAQFSYEQKIRRQTMLACFHLTHGLTELFKDLRKARFVYEKKVFLVKRSSIGLL